MLPSDRFRLWTVVVIRDHLPEFWNGYVLQINVCLGPWAVTQNTHKRIVSRWITHPHSSRQRLNSPLFSTTWFRHYSLSESQIYALIFNFYYPNPRKRLDYTNIPMSTWTSWYINVVGLRVGVSCPGRSWEFFLHHRVQNGSGTHPASHPICTKGS